MLDIISAIKLRLMMTLNKTAMKWTPIMNHDIFLTKGKFLDGSRYGEQMIIGILSFSNQYRVVIKVAKTNDTSNKNYFKNEITPFKFGMHWIFNIIPSIG